MMKSSAVSRRALLRSLLATSLVGLSGLAFAQDASVLKQEADGITVTLRLPGNGVVAGEESVLTIRLEHTSTDGKTQPLAFAKIDASAQTDEKAKPATFQLFPGGISGEYSLVGTFADAGTYMLTAIVTPNGGKPTTVTFSGITVKPAADKNQKIEPTYSLKMEAVPAQPLPAELVNLRFSIQDKDKKRVTDFEDIFDAPLHLYIMREDVNELHHEKPQLLTDAPGRKDDGIFSLNYTFPTGGVWRIIAEVAPRRDGAQILSTKITIPGARALPEPLMAQVSPVIQQSGITLRFDRPVRFVAKETVLLPLRLTDSQGNALSDMQFANGALAHLYCADKNGTFLHVLPDTSDPRTGRVGSNIMVFPVRFPKAGTYRVWLTFTRGTQPYNLSMVVKVYDK